MTATALAERLPTPRGRLTPSRSLADLTWFRVGGPAELLFQPADAADLAAFLAACPAEVPVMPVGVGSNLLVRDGGVPGVVVRLGRGFAEIEASGTQVIAGGAALDARVAQAASAAGVAGLEFLRTIPGSIGGALAMNAGCYGTEVKDRLLWAEAVTRRGETVRLSPAEMGFGYRRAAAAEGLVFTRAAFEGRPGSPAAISAHMAELMAKREASQPLRERTGGSTFANPSGASSGLDGAGLKGLRAWELIDRAGCRGLQLGQAKVSEKHCNFLINLGNATAADLEELGETVRARVKSTSDVDLHWEIRRIGASLQQ